jgi:hypothetical protein
MINTLQLVALLPLFNVSFPVNAKYLFTFIINVSSFNILPEKWMNALTSTFYKESNSTLISNEDEKTDE